MDLGKGEEVAHCFTVVASRRVAVEEVTFEPHHVSSFLIQSVHRLLPGLKGKGLGRKKALGWRKRSLLRRQNTVFQNPIPFVAWLKIRGGPLTSGDSLIPYLSASMKL